MAYSPSPETIAARQSVPTEKRYYDARQFRALGGCSRAQLYRLEKAGKLRLTRTADGRVLISESERARYFGETVQS